MPNLPRCGLALAAALSVFVRVDAALACGELPCAQLSEFQPPDGSVGVPLNTEIRVLYFGSLALSGDDPSCELDLRRMRLLPDGGEPIYLTGTVLPRPVAQQAWVIAQHVEPLLPNTAYALQLLLAEGREACRCDGLEWATVSSFTSGVAEDHEAPSFAGLASLEYGERLQGSSDCGTSDLMYVFPELRPVSDAAPAPRYNIYVNGEIATRYVEELDHEQYGELFVDCGGSSLTTLTALSPGARVEVRGVDLAGNESTPNTPLTVDATCGAPAAVGSSPSEGAVGRASSAPNASSVPAGVVPLTPRESSSGCDLSCSAGAASRAAAASTVGALLLLLGGRVRSRRRAGCGGGACGSRRPSAGAGCPVEK